MLSEDLKPAKYTSHSPWNRPNTSLSTRRLDLSNLDRRPLGDYGFDQDVVGVQEVPRAHLKARDDRVVPTSSSSSSASSSRSGSLDDKSDTSNASGSSSPDTLKSLKPLLLSDNTNPLTSYKSIATTFTPLGTSKEPSDYLKAGRAPYQASPPSECFAHKVASTEDLTKLISAYPLPALTCSKLRRDLRYVYFSTYRKLWAITILINIAVITVMLYKPGSLAGGFKYQQASAATAANFVVAALGRQEHVINLLFRIACLLPYCTPLYIRKQAAQVYSYGGLHSGCGIGAFLWYIIFTVFLIKQFEGTFAESAALGPTTAIILAILLLVLVTSHPYIRKRWHNFWEISHRYGGWTAIILSWAQTLIMSVASARQKGQSVGIALIESPSFWVLLVISNCLIYPWIRLRRRKVEAEKLSNHTVRLWFDEDKKLPTCRSHRLSHFPLVQNHGFVAIPNTNGQHGYSVIVSKAGDWTKDIIENPPKHIWTRGAPTTGVLRIATLFKPIVIVATGSGIAPCLSLLQVYQNHPMRIIWSARSPELTYGCRIMNAVLQADPQAMIIDTQKTGTPDLVALTYALYCKIEAEAVVVISNASVTPQLVYEMETRKIAAFGPIFDS